LRFSGGGKIGDSEDTAKNTATDDKENSLRVFHDGKRVVLWGLSDRLSVEVCRFTDLNIRLDQT